MPEEVPVVVAGGPPADIADAWRAVAGDDPAHLFPAAGGPCLCGAHPAGSAGGPATSVADNPRGRRLVPYCGFSLRLHTRRWAEAS